MAFESFKLGLSQTETCYFSFSVIKKKSISPQMGQHLRAFQQRLLAPCLGAGAFEGECSCSAISCARDLLEKAGSKVRFGAGERMGNLPIEQQKSIMVLTWPVVYFSLM